MVFRFGVVMVMRYLAISLEKLKAAMSNAGRCLKQESLQTDSVCRGRASARLFPRVCPPDLAPACCLVNQISTPIWKFFCEFRDEPGELRMRLGVIISRFEARCLHEKAGSGRICRILWEVHCKSAGHGRAEHP